MMARELTRMEPEQDGEIERCRQALQQRQAVSGNEAVVVRGFRLLARYRHTPQPATLRALRRAVYMARGR